MTSITTRMKIKKSNVQSSTDFRQVFTVEKDIEVQGAYLLRIKAFHAA